MRNGRRGENKEKLRERESSSGDFCLLREEAMTSERESESISLKEPLTRGDLKAAMRPSPIFGRNQSLPPAARRARQWIRSRGRIKTDADQSRSSFEI